MRRPLGSGANGSAQVAARRRALLHVADTSPATVGAESGISLVEVVMALVLVMVMLIPTASMAITGSKVVANSSAKRQATAIVNQQLALYTAQSPAGCGTCQTAASWGTGTPMTVAGLNFTVYEAGGWCVLNTGSNPATWGGTAASPGTPAAIPPGPPPTYHVVVKVKWGPTSGSSSYSAQSVVDQSDVGNNSNAPTSSTAPSGVKTCPIGLT